MNQTPTPHIEALPGDFAETVLMPGDPKRCTKIAESFLQEVRKISDVRGMCAYTGFYRGEKVSVMASGMGMPSMGIYAYELFHFYRVEQIIRVGTAGGMAETVDLRDLVLAMGACTNSAFAGQYHLPGTFAPICDYGLLNCCARTAERLGLPVHIGNVLTSDTFYEEETASEGSAAFAKMGVLAVEMETAALYMTAARAGKKALSILTISDLLTSGEATSSQERQNSFLNMAKLALETAITA